MSPTGAAASAVSSGRPDTHAIARELAEELAFLHERRRTRCAARRAAGDRHGVRPDDIAVPGTRPASTGMSPSPIGDEHARAGSARPGSRLVLPTNSATNRFAGVSKSSSRCADLLQHSGLEHGHAIGRRHRLFLVVRDEDRRDAERALQPLQFEPHLLAQLLVEVRQRLVEQQHLRLDDDGARERDALLLAARQLVRTAPGVVGQSDQRERLADATADLVARRRAVRPGRRRRCRTPSGAATARNSGTPCRCCVRAAARR